MANDEPDQVAATMNSMSVKIAEFVPKLNGPNNYPEWSTEIQAYFGLIDVTEEYTIWDVISGDYAKPEPVTKAWNKANGIALLTIKKHCEPNIKARIESYTTAEAAYSDLLEAFEGKSVTE